MTIEEMELIGEREGWFMRNPEYDKKKEYIAIGYLNQGDVDKLIEVFMRAIRNGNMTIEEMELIGEREGWFMHNSKYDKENRYV